jgi:hypothetical protein
VKEGGRIISWGALSPKFVNSIETCDHFNLERISNSSLVRCLLLLPIAARLQPAQAVDFRVHLAMSDDPPVRMQLDVLDAPSARIAMLHLTWAFVASRSQGRVTKSSGDGPIPAIRVAGMDAAAAAEGGRCVGTRRWP